MWPQQAANAMPATGQCCAATPMGEGASKGSSSMVQMTYELSDIACHAHPRMGAGVLHAPQRRGAAMLRAHHYPVQLASIILGSSCNVGVLYTTATCMGKLTKGRVALQRVQQHGVLLQQLCIFGTQRSQAGCRLVLAIHAPREPKEEPQAAEAQDCASQTGPGGC